MGVSARTVLGFLRHVARLAGVVDGRGGAVAIVQRFGGAMNLSVHAHALVIDGVCAGDGADVRFCPAPLLTAADVALIEEASVIERILRHLHLPTEIPEPRPGRAAPLPGTCSFTQDTDIAGFNSCA